MFPSVFAVFWDRLLAADPGFTRFLQAARVTLAVALSVVALAIGSTALDLPITVAILGAVVAMQASLAVNDSDPRTTTMLVPIPGFIGISLGAIFAPRGVIADFVFLVVLFAAVAVRLRGPRWTAFGTIAMMTYFFALFLGATIAQLPALLAAVLIGSAFTFAVRFIILPDQPAWIARRTIDAFGARIRFVAIAAQELLSARDPRRGRRRLSAAVGRLNETAASIEGRLGSNASDAIRVIFDAELAAEDLAASAQALRDAAAREPRALRLALIALGRGRVARAARVAALVPSDSHDGDRLHPAAQALASAIVDLSDAIGRVDSAAETLALSEGPWGGGAGVQQPVMRQAVQVTIASAAAIVVGEALSPQRWYWAVLATYFVFVGTASSGETFARAWSRIAGTALGVAAGILVGHIAQGHPWLDIGALFACLFLSVYFLRISQMIMIFFITAMLALLYTLLGRFSDGLLGIRLLETAIGAFFGGCAATFILPTRTNDVVRAQAKEALDAAATVVHASITRLIDGGDPSITLDAARVLEERVQQFILRAKPTIGSPVLIGRGHRLRRWIVSLSASSYYARLLARAADRMPPLRSANVAALLLRIDASIASNIRAAADRVDGRHDAASVSTFALFEELRRAGAAEGGAHPPVTTAAHLLERLDRTIARLARDEGTIVEPAQPRAVAEVSAATPNGTRNNARMPRPEQFPHSAAHARDGTRVHAHERDNTEHDAVDRRDGQTTADTQRNFDDATLSVHDAAQAPTSATAGPDASA